MGKPMDNLQERIEALFFEASKPGSTLYLNISTQRLIRDMQVRIKHLESAIENHLKYPLMGSKELKEVLEG